jgi:integrase
MKSEALNREITKEELEPFAQQHSEVKRWLRKVESPITKDRYTRSIIRYCEATEKTPYELIELKKNSKDHDAEDLLDEFVEDAQKANYPNSMIWDMVIAVKSFYKWNYADLSRGAGKITLIKVRAYRTPDKETLLKFLEGAQIRDKALVSLIACTGISEGSIPQLTWNHIWIELVEKNVDIPHIGLTSMEIKGKGKGKYEGVQQHTFLTPYARKTLLAYKEWRERKEGKQLTPESYMFVSVTKPFKKLTLGNVNRIFKQRSKDTGIKFSPHDLRRFVQTALETGRLQPNWIKKILRHKVSGEENPYSQPKIEALRDAYKTALLYLDLSERPQLDEMEMKRAIFKEDIRSREREGIITHDESTRLQNLVKFVKTSEEMDNIKEEYTNTKRRLRNYTVFPRRPTVDKKCENGHCQRIIEENELAPRLSQGWRYVATLPSGKIIVTND